MKKKKFFYLPNAFSFWLSLALSKAKFDVVENKEKRRKKNPSRKIEENEKDEVPSTTHDPHA